MSGSDFQQHATIEREKEDSSLLLKTEDGVKEASAFKIWSCLLFKKWRRYQMFGG
jgi:hypothetical protein